MRIGFIVGRMGGVDGIALEAGKWLAVLRRMGHEIFVLSGEFEGRPADPAGEDLLPDLSFYGPVCNWEQKQAFFGGAGSEDEVIGRIREQARKTAAAIRQWIDRRKIEVLVSENASAVPFHISMGMAIGMVASETGIPVIAHDHDLPWERPERYRSHLDGLHALMRESFPLRLGNVVHAVINSDAQAQFSRRLGISAVVVPNVMDFDQPFGLPDSYNQTICRDLRIPESDILLVQPTRIVRRKSIETAIRLVRELSGLPVRLLITGSPSDDPGGIYANELRALTARLGLEGRVLFAHRLFAAERGTDALGNRIYRHSDAYAVARACTFFSTYEGFGNTFVEAVLARRPIFVNNYEPVYRTDIGAKGFRAVVLEQARLTDEAVARMEEILSKPELAREIVEHNFALGKEHFSFQVLERKLAKLLRLVAGMSI